MAHVRWALNCRSNAMPCIRLLDSSAFGNGAWPEFLYYVWVECVFSLYVFPSSSQFISFIFVFLCKYSARQGGVFSVTCDSAPKKKAFVLAFSAIGFACWSSFLFVFFRVCAETPERKFWCGFWWRLEFPTFFHLSLEKKLWNCLPDTFGLIYVLSPQYHCRKKRCASQPLAPKRWPSVTPRRLKLRWTWLNWSGWG